MMNPYSVLDIPENEEELSDESDKTRSIDHVKGEVVFDHVNFGYKEDKIIIHDFSAKVSAGQKIAIVGPTGAGKTTIVNLLMRFYELNSGSILIDGTSIGDVTVWSGTFYIYSA